MKEQLKIVLLAIVTLCFGCSSSDDTPSGEGSGGVVIQASYRVTFEPDFTTQFHATDYPDDVIFDGLFLMAHGNNTSLFSLGSMASPGLKLYAEEGDSSTIAAEHTGGEDDEKPTTIVSSNDGIGPTQSKVFTINVTPDTTLLSLVTRISPSPDWFLGIDSFNLVTDENLLVESETIRLYAIDAGTDSGATYTSDNEAESQTIKLRLGLPLSQNADEKGKNLGILRIERINTN